MQKLLIVLHDVSWGRTRGPEKEKNCSVIIHTRLTGSNISGVFLPFALICLGGVGAFGAGGTLGVGRLFSLFSFFFLWGVSQGSSSDVYIFFLWAQSGFVNYTKHDWIITMSCFLNVRRKKHKLKNKFNIIFIVKVFFPSFLGKLGNGQNIIVKITKPFACLNLA